MTPVRLQLSRKKGFNLQTHSLAVNGLSAVNVARPSWWGNPYVVSKERTAAMCVQLFKERELQLQSDAPAKHAREMEKLRGKNLACFCKPGEPCHADFLLELANAPLCEEVAA
jgi:hypothetical protein